MGEVGPGDLGPPVTGNDCLPLSCLRGFFALLVEPRLLKQARGDVEAGLGCFLQPPVILVGWGVWAWGCGLQPAWLGSVSGLVCHRGGRQCHELWSPWADLGRFLKVQGGWGLPTRTPAATHHPSSSFSALLPGSLGQGGLQLLLTEGHEPRSP